MPCALCPRLLLARLPPLFDSAGLSPIGDAWASEKCAKTLKGLHTACTTFPQALELCKSRRHCSQERLFSRQTAIHAKFFLTRNHSEASMQKSAPVEKNYRSEPEFFQRLSGRSNS